MSEIRKRIVRLLLEEGNPMTMYRIAKRLGVERVDWHVRKLVERGILRMEGGKVSVNRALLRRQKLLYYASIPCFVAGLLAFLATFSVLGFLCLFLGSWALARSYVAYVERREWLIEAA